MTETSLPIARPRLISLDALRGFDMFWILGADEFFQALYRAYPGPATHFFSTVLNHANWKGLTPYDLIFPLFVFIAGAALVFSIERLVEQAGKRAAFFRLLKRGVLLYALGILYYMVILQGQVRLLGVLQRIAIASFLAGLVILLTKDWRVRLAVFAGILIFYWALMTYVPVPIYGAGQFIEGRNLANYIDTRFLPLYKWDGDHDPEGLLSTLPAVATCLYGVFAGMLLRAETPSPQKKVFWLLGMGAAGLLLGYVWSLQFPIIKKIWTSSYVLVAGGYSCLLLAVFYQVIDLWKRRAWAAPFRWIGSNAITLYLAFILVYYVVDSIRPGVEDFLSPLLKGFTEPFFPLLVVFLSTLLAWALYRNKLFWRV